jgi:putative aldouronate transport system substrate-binding protein
MRKISFKKVLPLFLSAMLVAGTAAACNKNSAEPPGDGGQSNVESQNGNTQNDTSQNGDAQNDAGENDGAQNTSAQNTSQQQDSAPESVAEALAPMDVTLYLWGDKPNQMDAVLDEFRARTKDSLNMNLSINWTPQADFPNNIQLKLSAGEAVDVCFDAPWMNMNTFILQGNYRDLTGYFHNDNYPGLKAAFNPEFLSNNYMGENADKVYGIPLTQSFGGDAMIFLRGDLREKYNLPPIADLAGFEAYLQAVLDNEPNMIPFVMRSDGTYSAGALFDTQTPEKVIGKIEAGIWDAVIAPGVIASLYIQDYQVISCAITGEPSLSKSVFPEPYNVNDYDTQLKIREWYEKGFIEKDVITRDDAQAAFTSGLGASFMWSVAQYDSVKTGLAGSVPNAVLEAWAFDPISQGIVKGMRNGAYTAWNFICVPVTTSDEKAERIMMFFDWMFSSSENHDLFEFGIEGVHWTRIGEAEYTYPEGIDMAGNYALPAYELTWNPNFIRYPIGYPDNVLNAMRVANDPEHYFNPMLSGFRFNGDPVKNELANPDFLEAKARRDSLLLGIYPDVIAENEKIDREMEALAVMQEDLAAIKAEVVSQAAVYLEIRKAQDAQNGTAYPTVAELRAQLP